MDKLKKPGPFQSLNRAFSGMSLKDGDFQLVRRKKRPSPGAALCPSKCCRMVSIKYTPPDREWPGQGPKKRAGVLVLDTSRRFVLLVQSCGWLWGAAKGVMELNETPEEAALRELREETGIEAENRHLGRRIKIADDSYYVLIYPRTEVRVPRGQEGNDVTGLSWVSLECLKKNTDYFIKILNRAARVLIYKGLYIGGYIKEEIS